jgi:hypothetical protein
LDAEEFNALTPSSVKKRVNNLVFLAIRTEDSMENFVRNFVEVTNPGGTVCWTIRGDIQV